MIEAVWLGISVFAFLYTVANLFDAAQAQDLLLGSDAKSRIQARANVRREQLRLVSITGCICIVIPALYRPEPLTLTVIVIAAMLIPVPLALNSFFDRLTRNRVKALIVQEQERERDAADTLAAERHAELTATVDATAAEVHDLHEGTAPEKAP